MKLIIGGYFDAGFSIGIDDHPFMSSNAITKLSDETGLTVSLNIPRDTYSYSDENTGRMDYSSDDSEGHIGISVPVGAGLKVSLSGSPLLEQLHQEALQAASNPKFMGEYYTEYPANIVDLVSRFQRDVRLSTASVNLFGLGIGYLHLESEELPQALKPFALWIYRCYEYAAYGTFSQARFMTGFRELVLTIYRTFSDSDNIHAITRRKIPGDFFPGFQVILSAGSDDECVEALKVLEDYDDLTPLKMDDGIIHLGWAAAVIQPTNPDYSSRILYLLKMAQVYYGICDGFERLFAHHISESVRQNLTGSPTVYDAISLNRLRTIAHTVAEYTRFRALTQNISDLKLLGHFDQLGDFSAKIDHLVAVCEIFTNIQNEFLQQKQARRDKRLNIYAMALTALTIVSVAADMMSISDTLEQKGWHLLMKVAAIQGLIILLIYMVFEDRWFRKGKKL
jgi:hypothetical protein